MGKALIVSGGTDGLYQVQLQYNRTRAEAQIATLTTELDAIPAQLVDLQAEINSASLALDYATEVHRAKITAYQAGPSDANSAALEQATAALRAAANHLRALKQSQRLLQLRQLSIQKQIDFLNDVLPTDIEVAAWCADYNEDLTGAVGLIESGLVEGDQNIIRPGGVDGDLAGYDATQDGQVTPIMSMSAPAAFLNYARLPGQTKWKPRYRLATITSLDQVADTCNLSLDSITSTHQRLDINQASGLSGVPVVYMGCNAAVFEVGDHVVVEFSAQDWSQPRVIGFVTDPRPCFPPHGLAYSLASGSWIIPLDGGAAKQLSKSDWPYGNVSWQNGEQIISWMGVPGIKGEYYSRVDLSGNTTLTPADLITGQLINLSGGQCQITWFELLPNTNYYVHTRPAHGQTIWRYGRVLHTISSGEVYGAAQTADDGTLYWVQSGADWDSETVWAADIVGAKGSNPRQIATLNWPGASSFNSGGLREGSWKFSADGLRAVAVRNSADGQRNRLLTIDPVTEQVTVTDRAYVNSRELTGTNLDNTETTTRVYEFFTDNSLDSWTETTVYRNTFSSVETADGPHVFAGGLLDAQKFVQSKTELQTVSITAPGVALSWTSLSVNYDLNVWQADYYGELDSFGDFTYDVNIGTHNYWPYPTGPGSLLHSGYTQTTSSSGTFSYSPSVNTYNGTDGDITRTLELSGSLNQSDSYIEPGSTSSGGSAYPITPLDTPTPVTPVSDHPELTIVSTGIKGFCAVGRGSDAIFILPDDPAQLTAPTGTISGWQLTTLGTLDPTDSGPVGAL